MTGALAVAFAIILASLCASVSPELSSFFIFDRNALMKGEIWRMFTCHFVHFSMPHLFYNLSVFGMAVYMAGQKQYPGFGRLCLWLALAISMALLIFKPNMSRYGGLSGIACGALYYCALMGLKEPRPWKAICALILFFLPIKIAVEIISHASVLPYGSPQSFIPMQTSHVVGVLGASLFYLIENHFGRQTHPPLQ